MDSLFDCLDDITKLNLIYTLALLTTVKSFDTMIFVSVDDGGGNMRLPRDDLDSSDYLYGSSLPFNATSAMFDVQQQQQTTTDITTTNNTNDNTKPCIATRMLARFVLLSNKAMQFIQTQLNKHTAASLALVAVLIIVVMIIWRIVAKMMRDEERRLKERYRKLKLSSSSLGNATHQSTTSHTLTSASNQSNVKYHQQVAHNDDEDEDEDDDDDATRGYNQKNNNCRRRRRSSTEVTSQSSQSRGSDGSTGHLLSANIISGAQNGAGGGLLGTLLADFNESLNSSLANGRSSAGSDVSKLKIHELRRETYFGLVRLLKPGCRTLVLLCDSQSKIKLLSKFYRCVYPYRKNKSLQFAFLLIEKNIAWYKELLRMALSDPRELQINPINCLGTVLVLNGFKKYFCIYHASESDVDSSEPCVLLEESLLDNLPDWLERLFTAKTSRYYLRYWPEKMR